MSNPLEIDGIRVVQDYEEIANALSNGETIVHWELGNSLAPLINNAEFCEISPIASLDEIKRGDCVFCKIPNADGTTHYMVHQVWEISDSGYDGSKWFKIGSTMASIFGWTKEVLGKAVGTNIFQDAAFWQLEEA